MRYKNDYFSVKTKTSFVKRLQRRYNLKKQTALRTFYKYRFKYGERSKSLKPKDESIKIEKPHTIKMLNFYDMKNHGYDITEEKLINMGFSKSEIKWLEKHENFNT